MSKMSFAVQTNGWEILARNVRKYAEEGMLAKSEEFKEKGAELYVLE